MTHKLLLELPYEAETIWQHKHTTKLKILKESYILLYLWMWVVQLILVPISNNHTGNRLRADTHFASALSLCFDLGFARPTFLAQSIAATPVTDELSS